ALAQAARGQLRKHGVRFGAYSIFMPALLKPAPARLKLALWALARKEAKDMEDPLASLPPLPTPGLTSVPADPAAPEGFYAALGFRVCDKRAVRLDMLERVADLIRPVIAARTYNGGFVVTPDMMSLVGCSGEEFASLLRGLGYRSQVEKIVPPAPPPAAEAPAEAPAETAAAEAAPAEEITTPEASAEEAPAEDATPQEATPQEAAPAEEAAETAQASAEPAGEEPASEEAAPEQAAPEQAETAE